MYVRIIKKLDGSIQVELVNEDKGIVLYFFHDKKIAAEQINRLLKVLKDFNVVSLEESIQITNVDLDLLLT